METEYQLCCQCYTDLWLWKAEFCRAHQCTRDRLVGEKNSRLLFLAKAVHSKRCSDCWEYVFHPRHAFTVCFTIGLSFSSPLKILNLHETWHKLAMMVGWLSGDQRAAFNIQMLWLCIHIKKKPHKIINLKFYWKKQNPLVLQTLTVRFQLTLRQGFCSVIKLLTDSVATVITCCVLLKGDLAKRNVSIWNFQYDAYEEPCMGKFKIWKKKYAILLAKDLIILLLLQH